MKSTNEEEQREVLDMMKPLIEALPGDKQEEARSIIRQEARGVFAWAVKSGYLLWSRRHPGKIPTMAQIVMWYSVAKGPF